MGCTAIIYQSKYGSTEKYAKWLCEEIGGDLYKKSEISISDLKKYDTIIYGGGLYITGIAGFSFIKNNYKHLEDKNIIVFAVGASPFDTGLIFEIPQGWGIQIKNKSGITVKGVPTTSGTNADITVFEGTVDMDYRGELGIMFKNEEDFEITIPKHTKLAQGVLRRVYNCTFVEVDEVNDTVRGEGGFGSTGTTINTK